jgi:hypothetical protein
MTNFGKYAILTPVEHLFREEPDWTWTIKPILSGEELERSKFLMQKRSITEGGQRFELPPTWLEVAHREIALTFGGTTIPKEVDSKEPALAKNASVAEIEVFLKTMPQPMVMEIWDAIGVSYPEWGPATPKAMSAV